MTDAATTMADRRPASMPLNAWGVQPQATDELFPAEAVALAAGWTIVVDDGGGLPGSCRCR